MNGKMDGWMDRWMAGRFVGRWMKNRKEWRDGERKEGGRE